MAYHALKFCIFACSSPRAKSQTVENKDFSNNLPKKSTYNVFMHEKKQLHVCQQKSITFVIFVQFQFEGFRFGYLFSKLPG